MHWLLKGERPLSTPRQDEHFRPADENQAAGSNSSSTDRFDKATDSHGEQFIGAIPHNNVVRFAAMQFRELFS
jgi:hypothetical protein